MKSMQQKLEMTANIAIVLVAVLLGAVIVNKFVLAKPRGLPKEIPVGSKVGLDDIAWAEHEKNILLILQKGCHFCTESAPFYQKLTQATTNRKDIKVIAVLPQKQDEGKAYLTENGVIIDDVRQASLDSMGLAGTPTLIIADQNGKVTHSWVGKLQATEEDKVLALLQ